MKLFQKDLDRDVVIVAEIGNNHEGNIGVAEELIEKAKDAGADAVKFQTFIPEYYVSGSDAARLERLQKFQFSEEQFEHLKRIADKFNLPFFSTPFDLHSLEVVSKWSPVIKISSGDNTFYPLLEAAAEKKKPMLLSTGLATEKEVELARKKIMGVWRKRKVNPGLILLHCVSSYPVPMEDANLSAITSLKKRFKGYVGYSDHTKGVDAAISAIAYGACLIEKHFTLDHYFSEFRDHQLSANPQEFKEIVQRAHDAVRMRGDGTIGIQNIERGNLISLRRSIAAKRDLPSGALLAKDDLTWVRPGEGFPPGEEKRLLGKRVVSSVKVGDIFLSKMIQRRKK